MPRAILVVFCFFVLVFSACKELPPPEVPRQDGGRFSHIPVPLSPAPIASVETVTTTEEAVTSTEEVSVATAEGTPAIEETAVSTPEGEVPTGVFGETTAEEALEENVVYAKSGAFLVDSKGRKRKVLDFVKAGEKLKVISEGEGNEEWYEVEFEGKKGFVKKAQVCSSTLCIEKLRCGVVPVYRESRSVLTPQIQVQFSNLTGAPISVLRVNAKFYYKGNYIGEDEAYVAAEVIGIKGLNNGDSTSVYFRPYYELPLDAVLTPENPIKVELLCAVEGRTFVPCGELSIDDMLY
jgi:uncharacterized protein YgiM (DUF1202 family)